MIYGIVTAQKTFLKSSSQGCAAFHRCAGFIISVKIKATESKT